MKKFLIQLLLFSIPFLIILGVPSYILWKSKENFYRIDSVISSNEKYLIGYTYNEINYGFLKWDYLNTHEKKTVWALGSSRVLQFRKNMFDASFYNAGYMTSKLNEFRPFLKNIPDNKLPDYIILGLDQWMFNDNWDHLNVIPDKNLWRNNFTLYPKPYPLYRTIYEDIFAGKYSFASLFEDKTSVKKIGLNAIMNDTGFRNDGSFFYGGQIDKLIRNDSTMEDFNYANTFERIKKGEGHFEYGTFVNNKALIELDKILAYCKLKKIRVIAILPPFPNKIFIKLKESHHYDYMKSIYQKVKPIIDKYQYEIHDLTNISSCGSNDFETIDGFHGGEVTYQKCLLTILKSGSILNKVATIQKLEFDLLHKKNNYTVYGY